MSTDLMTSDDLSEQVFAARVEGASENAVAKRFGIAPRDVREVVDRLALKVDAGTRMRELILELHRIANLQQVYYGMAMQQDHQAAAIAIKLSERKAAMLAFDHAPHRQDVLVSVPEHRSSSTELIRAAIEHVNERPAMARPVAVTEVEPEPEPEILGSRAIICDPVVGPRVLAAAVDIVRRVFAEDIEDMMVAWLRNWCLRSSPLRWPDWGDNELIKRCEPH